MRHANASHFHGPLLPVLSMRWLLAIHARPGWAHRPLGTGGRPGRAAIQSIGWTESRADTRHRHDDNSEHYSGRRSVPETVVADGPGRIEVGFAHAVCRDIWRDRDDGGCLDGRRGPCWPRAEERWCSKGAASCTYLALDVARYSHRRLARSLNRTV